MGFSPPVGIQFVDYCCAGSGEEHKIAPFTGSNRFQVKKKKKHKYKNFTPGLTQSAKRKISYLWSWKRQTFVWLEKAFFTLCRSRGAKISDENPLVKAKRHSKSHQFLLSCTQFYFFFLVTSLFLLGFFFSCRRFFFFFAGRLAAFFSLPMFEPVCFPARRQQRAGNAIIPHAAVTSSQILNQ